VVKPLCFLLMNHKPQLEPYNSLLFDKANLKCARVIIKHRH